MTRSNTLKIFTAVLLLSLYFIVGIYIVSAATEVNLNYDMIIEEARKQGMGEQEIADMLSTGDTQKIADALSGTKIELTYPWSKETDFRGLVSEFYNIALGLVGVVALGAIIYGGILWTVSKTPSGSQEAKDWITGAISGLLLLLGAYLLFNTIGIIKEGKLVEPGITVISTEPTVVEEPTVAEIAKTKPKEAQLKAVGIEVSCSAEKDASKCNKNAEGHTYIEGLTDSTMQRTKAIYQSCHSTVCKTLTITGAAEMGSGHDPNGDHPKGLAVDFRYDEKLSAYLKANQKEFHIKTIIDSPHGTGAHIHVSFY